jgi:hypothetical protein
LGGAEIAILADHANFDCATANQAGDDLIARSN